MPALITESEKYFANEVSTRLIRGEKKLDLTKMANVPYRSDKNRSEWIAEILKDNVSVDCYVIDTPPMQHLQGEFSISTDFSERLDFATNSLFIPLPYGYYFRTYHKDTFK
jgi:hypothetical protein